MNTYAYNHANRLSSVTGPQSESSYAYNGMGDRVQQTVDGATTTYTLDLAIGLTQILDDGENTYLYGIGRIGENGPGGWAYHHGDALGSVRQLTDESGVVTLVKEYQPYGDVMSSSGGGVSSYGFTGEWRDVSGMVYLRARYYSPWQGRFMTRDSWAGDVNAPMSYNEWLYVYGNPINLVDPSGTNPIDWPITQEVLKKLYESTKMCYEAGDLDCVWRNYFTIAYSANLLGYNLAASHMYNFLLSGGDIVWKPGIDLYNPAKFVLAHEFTKDYLRQAERKMWQQIQIHVKTGSTRGWVSTPKTGTRYPPLINHDHRDLYYALGQYYVWIEAYYEVSGCYDVLIEPTYWFEDTYDWHFGLPAGGDVPGIQEFPDDWAAALKSAGKAAEYEITGYWEGPDKIYAFPGNWFDFPKKDANDYISVKYANWHDKFRDIFK